MSGDASTAQGYSGQSGQKTEADQFHAVRYPQKRVRLAQFQQENAALHRLMRFSADGETEMLGALAETVRDVCAADSVGISIEDVAESGSGVFRWIAGSGGAEGWVGMSLPRLESPGMLMNRETTQLVQRPGDIGRYAQAMPNPDFQEAILVPWRVREQTRGMLWVLSHSGARRFDEEDKRMVESLAVFVAAAVQLSEKEAGRRESQSRVAASEMAHELAHEINNPLQGLTNTLHLLCAEHPGDLAAQAEQQLARVTELVRAILALQRKV